MYRRIRDLREDRDLRQKDLAEVLHCTQVCYSHYEIGKRDIPTGCWSSWRRFTAPAPTTCWASPMNPPPIPRAREKQDP